MTMLRAVAPRGAARLDARRPPLRSAPGASSVPPTLWLDVSRLLWRVFRGTLTGVDRVELAYAEHLLAEAGSRLRFVAFDYRGGFGLLPQSRTAALVRAIGPAWEAGTLGRLKWRALALFGGSLVNPAGLPRATPGQPRPVYVNVSHHPLAHTGAVARMLERTGAGFVPLVHDVIPIDYPEYVGARETARHRRRIATIAGLADGVIANSGATAAAMAALLPPGLPVLPVPLGVVPRRAAPIPPALADGAPFFLCLGTIEPRKNHLLLLQLWRRMAEEALPGGPPLPKLVIVGNRGWDNEQVLDLLDRSVRLRPHVLELGRVSDGVVAGLMARARALLMPSFIEGFGLPVAEALARGAPVLCSDIPAHREVAGHVAEYLDPLDALAWQEAVQAYAEPGSPRRAAQIRRIAGWEAPGWPAHIDAALAFIEELTASQPPRTAAAVGAPRPMLVEAG
jgi:glycosyltransferase involved in cell wall biosynthesis